jgi:hypothetical protein
VRRVAATALALVALAALPASAGGGGPVRFTDPKGDWKVDSQDVTGGRISSALVAGRPVLRGELTLAAAPGATTAPGSYTLAWMVGCQSYSFNYEWQPGGYTGSLLRYDYCHERPTVSDVDETFPATVTTKGSTLVFETPYVRDIKRGARLLGLIGGACPKGACVIYGDTRVDEDMAIVGDLGFSRGTYVVGSDLPRR